MFPLRRPVRVAVNGTLVCLALIATAATSRAQAWVEQGDAGDLVSSSQLTVGNGPLTTISGNLPIDADVDMYCISVTDPVNFRAYLTCAAISQNDIWIFNAGGLGIARDRGCQSSQTRVGAPIVTTAGFYYLAVSGNDARAQNAGSDLWLIGTPVNGQAAPNGPAAGLPLTAWLGGVVNPVAYTIQLVGASFCDGIVPTSPRSWGATKVIYR